ncbi:uncharacterized protein LAJ45_08362 [Morchella importuna]|uniref:uncharacterized protein n=1 Tax=Morchella importuna TaxID=1174673 RepID=UPI001E8D85B3|nr:uncharacterized protein LAJ45_08362 [Morchella importuna]KAH8147535.1 hypothetical protein LAJ45_08362 [Morchella importuna]
MSYQDEQPLLGSKRSPGTFGKSVMGSEELKLPQAIAHRGFQAQFPENTILAFEGAVKAGAHAIETDLHLSRDGVVMISHDATLKRVFGEEGKVIDCDYSYLKTLRTVEAPHVPMASLKEVLELLCQPALRKMWLLLDIKIDNDAENIIRLTAETLKDVGGGVEFWGNRVVLGCWTLNFIPLCERYLPGFPITHIGYSIPYAREFLKIPNVSFNMRYAILDGPKGEKFLKDARAAGRDVYTWTVNDEQVMKWTIAHGIDVKFLDICEKYLNGEVSSEPWSCRMTFILMYYQFLAYIFSYLFRCRHGFTLKTAEKAHLAP